MKTTKITRLIAVLLFLALVAGCVPKGEENNEPHLSLFVGIDVSGSFTQTPHFKDALRFLSYYLYAHLNGVGGAEKVRALFVGSIGGNLPNEPQAFYPIQDFQRKTVIEIEDRLLELFTGPVSPLTDFNAYFRRVSEVTRKWNLALAPVMIVVVSDGVPDVAGGRQKLNEQQRYENIDVSPLEFLARNVTIRVLYPAPAVAAHWERRIPRQRVRIWPVEAQVMQSWAEQLDGRPKAEEEERLWDWIADIVDKRVRRQRIL